MDSNQSTGTLDNRKLFGVFALVASLAALILLGLIFLQKTPKEANDILNHIAAHKGSYVLYAGMSLLWSIVSVPVIIGIGFLTRKTGQPALMFSAVALTSAGVLLSGIVSFFSIGASLAIESANGIEGANTTYAISFWSNLFYYLTDPALMLWGLGQLLLGILLLRLGTFPKWVTLATLLGGIAGLLTLFVYQTPILAFFQQITFLGLTLYCAVLFFKK